MTKNEIVKLIINKHGKEYGMLIMSELNRKWLTGFATSLGYLIINSSGKMIFITDSRYILAATKKMPKNIEIQCIDAEHGIKELVNLAIKKLGIKNILLEQEYTKLEDLSVLDKGLLFTPFNSRELRVIKDDQEVALLVKAADIAVETVKWVWTWIKPGISEKEISKRIAIKFLELGASGNSFDTIVAAHKNGASPHHESSDYIIQDGDMITIDLGCVYEGFASDMTRTFVVGKKCSEPEMLKIYEIVKQSQQNGLEAAILGNTTKQVDQACRDFIDKTIYKGLFAHGTGHGVGLEVHELPVANAKTSTPLEINHVITVEPGIYKENVGGVRIEDTIIIKKDKPLILTNACSKELLYITNK